MGVRRKSECECRGAHWAPVRCDLFLTLTGGERWVRRQRREERLSVVLRAANQNFYACRWQAYLYFVAAVEKTEPFSNGDKFFRAPQQGKEARADTRGRVSLRGMGGIM